jgi:hypothetical protein
LAYYHSAVLITYLPHASEGANTIIYTPHGIPSPSLSLEQLNDSGITSVTALLHGLHEVWNSRWLGGKLNLGAQNGLEAVRKIKAKYWVGTHDEIKKGGGFVAWVLKRRIWGVEEAMRREGIEVEKGGNDNVAMKKGEMSVKYVTLDSGESIELR